jgi:hypothetical protein
VQETNASHLGAEGNHPAGQGLDVLDAALGFGSLSPPMSRHPKRAPEVIGWREWVALPDLGIQSIKAKVDTGARTSSLHAYDVEEFVRHGVRMVRFKVHPEQRNSKIEVAACAPLDEHRHVRPSSGTSESRPVVLTTIELLGRRLEVELTLTRRDEMGFRMLLGHQATRGHFIVDPGRSFLNGRRIKGTRGLKPPRGRKP